MDFRFWIGIGGGRGGRWLETGEGRGGGAEGGEGGGVDGAALGGGGAQGEDGRGLLQLFGEVGDGGDEGFAGEAVEGAGGGDEAGVERARVGEGGARGGIFFLRDERLAERELRHGERGGECDSLAGAGLGVGGVASLEEGLRVGKPRGGILVVGLHGGAERSAGLEDFLLAEERLAVEEVVGTFCREFRRRGGEGGI